MKKNEAKLHYLTQITKACQLGEMELIRLKYEQTVVFLNHLSQNIF